MVETEQVWLHRNDVIAGTKRKWEKHDSDQLETKQPGRFKVSQLQSFADPSITMQREGSRLGAPGTCEGKETKTNDVDSRVGGGQ